MESNIVIARPDEAEIRNEYSPVVEQAVGLEVCNKPQHESAQICLRVLRSAKNRVKDRLDPIISDAHKAHRGLTKLRGDLLKPLDEADRIVNGKIDTYEEEQARLADEIRRAAEAEARKLEEERRLMEAIEAEKDGDQAEADAILAEPIETPTIQVETETAKVDGISHRTSWSALVVDTMALIRYVAANPEWSNLLQPDMPALNGLARSQRNALKIPGVRAVPKTVRAVRA